MCTVQLCEKLVAPIRLVVRLIIFTLVWWLTAGVALAGWPPSGGWVVANEANNTFVIDASTGEILRALPSENGELKLPERLFPASEVVISKATQRLAVSQIDGGIRVWDLPSNRIIWSHSEARAISFLGSDHRRIAVLTRAPRASRYAAYPSGKMVEFAIWDLDSDKKVFSRMLPSNIQSIPHPLGSSRFAAFTIDLRDIWIWDDAKNLLRAIPLPSEALIHSYATGDTLGARAMILAPDGRTLVFGGALPPRGSLRLRSMDIDAWSPPRRYDNQALGDIDIRLLGVSADTHYLIAMGAGGLLQIDLVTGTVVHKWTVKYHERIITWRTFRRKSFLSELLLSEKTSKHDYEVLRSEPEVSPDGQLLAIWDYAQKKPVIFDITRSPPQEVSPSRKEMPVCDKTTDESCGIHAPGESSRKGYIRFLEPGGDLVVFASGADIKDKSLWHFDRFGKSGKMSRLPKALKQATSDDAPRACNADPDVCVKFGNSELRNGRLNTAAKYFESACFMGGRNDACQQLIGIARTGNDQPTLELATAASCAPHLATTGKLKEVCSTWQAGVLANSLVKTLRDRCHRQGETCWAAALALSRGKNFTQDILALTEPACRTGHRPACMAGADQALRLGLAEKSLTLFNQACGLRLADDCRNGERQAMAKVTWQSWARPGGERPVINALQLCDQHLVDNKFIMGTPHEIDGRFVGIRLERTLPTIAGEVPLFEPGDILFNGGWCSASGCDGREFIENLWRACRSDQLVRDVRLEVGSADKNRNRVLILATKRSQ